MKFNKACDAFVAFAVAYFAGHLLHIVLPLVVAILGAVLVGFIVFSIVSTKPNI